MRVDSTAPGSPAAMRGLEEGDLIISVNRVRVRSVTEMQEVASGQNLLILGSDGSLTTVLGTPVVAGVGYAPAVVPAAPAAITLKPAPAASPLLRAPAALVTTQWMYATGPVVVHLGPVDQLGEFLDHTNNDLSVVAGRAAAVYFDGCCHFSANVDVTA